MDVSNQRIVLQHTSANGAVARNVRGSLIASSLQTLRDLGYYDRYLKLLPPIYRDQVLFALASSWLPMEVAEAHYQACDNLGLEDVELMHMGEAVSQRIMGTYLATMMRTGRTIGTTSPWLPLGQYHRVCQRIIDGGTFMVSERGPKDAVIDTRGLALFRFRYFRVAALGIFRGAAGMFAKTCYARELPSRGGREQLLVSLSWV